MNYHTPRQLALSMCAVLGLQVFSIGVSFWHQKGTDQAGTIQQAGLLLASVSILPVLLSFGVGFLSHKKKPASTQNEAQARYLPLWGITALVQLVMLLATVRHAFWLAYPHGVLQGLICFSLILLAIWRQYAFLKGLYEDLTQIIQAHPTNPQLPHGLGATLKQRRR